MMATSNDSLDTKLWDAAKKGDIQEMKCILIEGANIHYKHPIVDCWTPLHVAAANNRIAAVLLLLSKGADIESRDINGDTPLIEATFSGCKESVNILLENGANPSIVNNDNWTSLDFAEKRGHPDIAEIIAFHLERNALRMLETGMKEGYVTLHITKITICGPPSVGKTAFKALLLNQAPPLKHHSTPIATHPIQAIQRVSAEGSVWEEVSEQDLLMTLSDACIRTTNEETIASNVETSCAENSQSQPLHSSSSSSGTGAVQPLSEPSSMGKSTEYYSENILHYLKSRNAQCSRSFHEAHWIHLLDSGGQPQFSDMLRIFNRGNSLYVIVMKITESLEDKPTFTYSVNGTPLSVPKELTATNLQIIENFVRSVAASRSSIVKIGDRSISGKPAFAIVATHCDKSKFKRLIGLKETIKEKNAELQSHLKEFLDLFIYYKHDSNKLIFPVDNLCVLNRRDISAKIRERIMSCTDIIGFGVQVPIRWYMFEIKMKEEAAATDSNHGMISLDSCYTIGIKLGMIRSDVDQCLVYLDSMTLCLYYPSILPRVVFTNSQFLIDSLSNIVRLSFIDNEQSILPKGVGLSDEVLVAFKRDGVFDESLLDGLGLTFVSDLFSKSDLLSLLQYLHLISPINSSIATHYFMPIVLPPQHTTQEKKDFWSKAIDPLLITFNSKLVLQALFPTLIVCLLSRQEEPHFFIDSCSPAFPRQLRHAVKLYSEELCGSVVLCDNIESIEVYFTGLPKHCYLLRKVILKALLAGAELLSYDNNVLETSALVRCSRKHEMVDSDKKPHPVKVFPKESPLMVGCSLETGLSPVTLDERQSCWLIDLQPDPVSNILPQKTALNQSHSPIIMKAIEKIVYEWEALGLFLGIEDHKLKQIKYNCRDQVQVCRKDMICHWLEMGNATREGLILALETAGRRDVAAEVKHLPTT